MATTRIMDVDEERLLRHFCLEAECTQVLDWFKDQGYSRPEEFEGRLQLSSSLREKGNIRYKASDFEGAMMHAFGALHCIDFSQARSALQTDAQKREVHESLLPILSNLSIVFLKRKDAYNSARAADLGLDYARKLPAGSAEQLRAKLLFRRGLARGQKNEFADACVDLREAAKLMPDNRDVRHALENCKAAIRQQRGAPDDKWRGVLTETPQKAQRWARLHRCCMNVRMGTREVLAGLKNPQTLKVIALLLFGPLISIAPVMMARWAVGRR